MLWKFIMDKSRAMPSFLMTKRWGKSIWRHLCKISLGLVFKLLYTSFRGLKVLQMRQGQMCNIRLTLSRSRLLLSFVWILVLLNFYSTRYLTFSRWMECVQNSFRTLRASSFQVSSDNTSSQKRSSESSLPSTNKNPPPTKN